MGALILLFAFAGVAGATNGMKMMGNGPVQRSMGGAAVGLPLDAATTITNPAGMARLDKRLDLGVTYFSPRVSYKATSNSGMVTTNGAKMKSDTSASFIPGLGQVALEGTTNFSEFFSCGGKSLVGPTGFSTRFFEFRPHFLELFRRGHSPVLFLYQLFEPADFLLVGPL